MNFTKKKIPKKKKEVDVFDPLKENPKAKRRRQSLKKFFKWHKINDIYSRRRGGEDGDKKSWQKMFHFSLISAVDWEANKKLCLRKKERKKKEKRRVFFVRRHLERRKNFQIEQLRKSLTLSAICVYSKHCGEKLANYRLVVVHKWCHAILYNFLTFPLSHRHAFYYYGLYTAVTKSFTFSHLRPWRHLWTTP